MEPKSHYNTNFQQDILNTLVQIDSKVLQKFLVNLLSSGATCYVTNEASDLFNVKDDKTKIIVDESLTCETSLSGCFCLHRPGTSDH